MHFFMNVRIKHSFILEEAEVEDVRAECGLSGHESSANQTTQARQHSHPSGQADRVTAYFLGVAGLSPH